MLQVWEGISPLSVTVSGGSLKGFNPINRQVKLIICMLQDWSLDH